MHYPDHKRPVGQTCWASDCISFYSVNFFLHQAHYYLISAVTYIHKLNCWQNHTNAFLVTKILIGAKNWKRKVDISLLF